MKKTNLIITFAITAILTSLVSCSKQDVTGTWELTIFEKDGIAQELCIASLTLENEDKVLKAFGNSGVNNYSGEIKLSGKKAKTVNEFVCTKMMGPEKALEFESLFLKAMNEISSMEANKKTGELIIKSKSAIMKFTRATLTNKKWTLSSSLEVNDKTPFIIFDKEGKLYYFYSKIFSDEHEPLKENSYVCEINSELELVNERSVNEIFGYEEFNLCDVVFDEDNIMYCMYKINDDFYIGKAKLTSGEFLGSQLIASGEYYNSIIDIDSFGNILTGMVKSVDNGAVYSIDSYDTDTLTMLSHNEYDEYTRSGYDGFTHGAGGYDFILVNGRTFKGYDAGTNTLTELFTKELSEREKLSAYGNYLMAMAYEDQLIICEKYLKEG